MSKQVNYQEKRISVILSTNDELAHQVCHVTSFYYLLITISTSNPNTGSVCYSQVLRSGNTASLVNQPVGFCYLKIVDSRHHIVTLGASMSQFIQHQCDRQDRLHKSVTRLQVAANMHCVSLWVTTKEKREYEL